MAMRNDARRIAGAGQYGLDGWCWWPILDGGKLVLRVDDCLEVFLTAAEALGMGAVERDELYERLADRALREEWKRPAAPPRAEVLARLLYETRRRAAWLEYRLAQATRALDYVE